MAARYRKKPVVIEAMQWDGTAAGAGPVIDWVLRHGGTASYWCSNGTQPIGGCADKDHTLAITTLEGIMQAGPGWWVVRGVEGEFYPVRDDIFAATYEPEQEWSCRA